MARELSEKEQAATGLRAAPPRRRYPWKQWANGSVWQLVEGEDYTPPGESFRVTAYQYARRHGLKATTRVTPTGLIIQFTPIKENA